MPNKTVFVFGSNEGGIHGGGAAKVAYEKHGARYGCSYGHYGDSFAIPTKDQRIGRIFDFSRIKRYVDGFLAYAEAHPELTFKVTRVGCGLAGYSDQQMAGLFYEAPPNCQFDKMWEDHMPDDTVFWGSHP